jgi:hypothetical protein
MMGNAMHRKQVSLWYLCVALIASAMSIDVFAADASSIASPADIGCRLAISERLNRNQPAVLTLTVQNQSKQTLRLLKRNTPLEGWLADSLIVERDGQSVPYSGAMAKRMPPTASEYLRLKPGAVHRYRAALQQAYDVSQPGSYRVQWRGDLMDAFSGNGAPNPDQLSPQTITCAAVSFVRAP